MYRDCETPEHSVLNGMTTTNPYYQDNENPVEVAEQL